MRNSLITDTFNLFAQQLGSVKHTFKRSRLQNAESVLLTLMLLVTHKSATSTKRALSLLKHKFPKSVGRDRQEPSAAAFCKARKNITPDAITELFHTIHNRVAKNGQLTLIHGLRFIAVDGTKINLPRTQQTVDQFGCYRTNRPSHQPQSHMVAAWDAITGSPCDWVCGKVHASERDTLCAMAKRLPQKSLVLLDRGFHGIAVIHALEQHNHAWFMRARQGITAWRGLKPFINGRCNDQMVTLDGQIDHKAAAVKVRAIRAKRQVKKSGKWEQVIFLTNLTDKKKWPRSLLLRLYEHRWAVETAFREMKIHDMIENLHSRSPDGIKQEIGTYMIARLLAASLTRTLIKRWGQSWKISDRKRVNHVALMDAFCDLFMELVVHKKRHTSIFIKTCLNYIDAASQRMRPGRSYKRRCRGRYGRWKHTKNDRAQLGRNGQVRGLS